MAVFSFMRIGIVMEEILNPRMKASSSIYKLFRHLNNDYLDEVFRSMDDEESAEPPGRLGPAMLEEGGRD